jgi:hypothetical protein
LGTASALAVTRNGKHNIEHANAASPQSARTDA